MNKQNQTTKVFNLVYQSMKKIRDFVNEVKGNS